MPEAPKPTRYSRIEISRHGLNFAAAHFTMFSATERENLHGHNFEVECHISAPVHEDGLTLDYGIIKQVFRNLCSELDEKTLLPGHSPHLEIVTEGDYQVALFNDERIPFLHRDVMILPITNITVEELSHYLLQGALEAQALAGHGITEITVKISSGPGQIGTSTWSAQ